jgi:hypothetical protein
MRHVMPPRFSVKQSGQSWRFRDYLCPNQRHRATEPVEIERIASDMMINEGSPLACDKIATLKIKVKGIKALSELLLSKCEDKTKQD